MHSLIIGMTESGKTTLAKMMVARAEKRGIKTAILDPIRDPEYKGSFQTSNQEEFLSWVKKNKSALLIIDEAGTAIGRYNTAMEWVVTTSRHLGHSAMVICQGASQLSPLVRGQCTSAYLFACTEATRKIVSQDFNTPEVLDYPRLLRGEFLHLSRYEKPAKYRLDFKSRKILEIPLDNPEKVGKTEVEPA